MRIDEFKRIPTHHITTPDRVRLVSVGFDLISILMILCSRYLESHITDHKSLSSIINADLPMYSIITKEKVLDGNLCW